MLITEKEKPGVIPTINQAICASIYSTLGIENSN